VLAYCGEPWRKARSLAGARDDGKREDSERRRVRGRRRMAGGRRKEDDGKKESHRKGRKGWSEAARGRVGESLLAHPGSGILRSRCKTK
jgi:hypothetical protein